MEYIKRSIILIFIYLFFFTNIHLYHTMSDRLQQRLHVVEVEIGLGPLVRKTNQRPDNEMRTSCRPVIKRVKTKKIKKNLSEVGFEPTPSFEDQNLSLAP